MKSKKTFVMCVVLLLCMIICFGKQAYVSTMSETVVEIQRVVVIDAGHGGNDPGKIGINQVLEKDVNLQIARRVRTLLEQNDVKVIMTREEDEGLYDAGAANKKVQDMKKRIELIAESNAPITVSIHQNSYSDESIHGAQVFYYTSSKEGKAAAILMQQQLVEGLDPENRREAKANDSYYLLKKSTTPTIIVECGFLSNYEEAEELKTQEYQEKVAFHITMGILKYLNQS